jgi:hypothetical protein
LKQFPENDNKYGNIDLIESLGTIQRLSVNWFPLPWWEGIKGRGNKAKEYGPFFPPPP